MQRVTEVSESQLKTIANQSFMNCHAPGLHSVMFDNTPEARIRCFIADRDHDMDRNMPKSYMSMSVAFHPHHCDVTLDPVYGRVFNVRPIRVQDNTGHHLAGHVYNSAITNPGGGHFERDATLDYNAEPSMNQIGFPLFLTAQEQHTIFLPRYEEAAWFVYEGKEDPLYVPRAWSNTDLRYFNFAGLYQPMSVEQLKHLLNRIEVKVV